MNQEHRALVLDALKTGKTSYKQIEETTGLTRAQVGRSLSALYNEFGAAGLHNLVAIIRNQYQKSTRNFLTLDESLPPERAAELLIQVFGAVFCQNLMAALDAALKQL